MASQRGMHCAHACRRTRPRPSSRVDLCSRSAQTEDRRGCLRQLAATTRARTRRRRSRGRDRAPTRFLRDWVTVHYLDRLLELWQAADPGLVRLSIILRGPMRAAISLARFLMNSSPGLTETTRSSIASWSSWRRGCARAMHAQTSPSRRATKVEDLLMVRTRNGDFYLQKIWPTIAVFHWMRDLNDSRSVARATESPRRASPHSKT